MLKNVSLFLLVVGLALIMGSCANQQPIKVGFSGELTGSQGELAVTVRNGVQLAVEDINANGGINGRRLKLLIEDDRGNPNTAKHADRSLIEQGVVAIIGHATSNQTAAVLEQINEAKMILLSPTSSSTEFSNQKDYFFRVTASADTVGANFAKYAYNSMGLRRMSGVYDLDNEAFTRSFWQAFSTKFEILGGEVEQAFPYNSSKIDLSTFAEEIMATDPSALLFVTSDLDAAFLAQQINVQDGKEIVLLSSTWGQTQRLLAKGGSRVENMEFITVYDKNNPDPQFQAFVKSYQDHFGSNEIPDFGSVYGYESVLVLAEALKETGGEAAGLPEALVNVKDFPVLQGSITMDEYGDVERDFYVAKVQDGQFKVVDTILSSD